MQKGKPPNIGGILAQKKSLAVFLTIMIILTCFLTGKYQDYSHKTEKNYDVSIYRLSILG